MRVAVLAGERSGDVLGAGLLSVLDHAEAFGMTGPRMRAAGVTSLADADALQHVGFEGVVRSLPALWRLAASLEADVVQRHPDVVVTIDSPSFMLRLSPRFKERGIRTVHLVSPQIWAWRGHRAQRIARAVDALGCLLPFEAGRYPRTDARFVGHPAAAVPMSNRPAAIGFAAGSRPSERASLGPKMADVSRHLGMPAVEAVPIGCTPAIPGARRVDSVAAMAPLVRAAVVCSGTATLELGAAGVPMHCVYTPGRLTSAIGRSLLKIPWISLPNLVLGRALVPETVGELDPVRLAHDVGELLGPAGDSQARDLLELRTVLKPEHAYDRMAALLSR